MTKYNNKKQLSDIFLREMQSTKEHEACIDENYSQDLEREVKKTEEERMEHRKISQKKSNKRESCSRAFERSIHGGTMWLFE